MKRKSELPISAANGSPLVPSPTLGAAIKRLRMALKCSQAHIARDVGVNYSAVCAWERNRRHPRSQTLLLLRDLAVKNGLADLGEQFAAESKRVENADWETPLKFRDYSRTRRKALEQTHERILNILVENDHLTGDERSCLRASLDVFRWILQRKSDSPGVVTLTQFLGESGVE